jgi:signal peptidase II
MRIFILSALLVLALDQGSKNAILYLLDLPNRGMVEVFPPFLVFLMGWNTGINFGLFANNDDLARWVLVAVSLAICAWIAWWVLRPPRPRAIVMVSGGAIIGGALGNVMDRVIYGAVVDFLNMSCCGITNPFAFNIADIAIFAGAIGLLIFTDQSKTS